MPRELNVGGFSFGSGPADAGPPVSPAAPFHLCILGDFGATGDQRLLRRAVEIDRDNFEDVLGRLNVVFDCEMPAGQPPAAIQFHTLDDFHPDQLLETVPVFDSLRQLRRRLLNPATFAAAAAEVRAWLPAEATETPAAAVAPAGPIPDTANLLDGILDAADEAAAGTQRDALDWNSIIRDIVRPYSIPAIDPQRDVLVECVDAVLGRTMTALLHHPRFRALESAWRGVWFLVRRLETDSRLKVFLLDVPRAELDADVAGDEDLTATTLYRDVVERTIGTPGAQPWGALLGLYEFGPDDIDAVIVGRLAAVARAAGAPLIAAATGAHHGCVSPDRTPEPADWHAPSASVAWQDLRSSADAAWVSLIWPSFLLRLPYGPRTSATEAFDFTEIPAVPQHDDYLWGHPALIAGCLLGQSYTESGWKLRIGEQSEVGGLPQHIDSVDGETIARPCTGLLLSETGARRVAACGLTPLWAVRDQDVVQLPTIKSLTGEVLAGRWGRSV